MMEGACKCFRSEPHEQTKCERRASRLPLSRFVGGGSKCHYNLVICCIARHYPNIIVSFVMLTLPWAQANQHATTITHLAGVPTVRDVWEYDCSCHLCTAHFESDNICSRCVPCTVSVQLYILAKTSNPSKQFKCI